MRSFRECEVKLGFACSRAFLFYASFRSDHQRELRVVRITNVDDPNEEPLHWAQAMQLTTSFYTTDKSSLSRTRATQAPTRSSDNQKQGSFAHGMWERVGREAFFHLCVSVETKQLICGGEHVDQRHVVLVDVIERLLSQQKNLLKTKQRGLRVTFSELLASESTLGVSILLLLYPSTTVQPAYIGLSVSARLC